VATQIFFKDGLLSFDGSLLATKEQYELADRCVDSVFESLNESERIVVSILDVSENEGEGGFEYKYLPYEFELDKNLDLKIPGTKALTIEEIKEFDLLKYYYPDRGEDWNPFWYENGTINVTDKFAGCWTFDPKSRDMSSNF
jgi:hypothetical protein